MFSVSIIGAGKVAEEHIKAFQSINGVSVQGILSRTKSKALRLAQLYDIPIVANDVQDLYLRTRSELVVIAVTIDATKDTIESCWKYDWKVLTEKPLGLNYDEAQSLSKKAVSLRKDCFIAFNRRHFASVRWVKNRLTRKQALYLFLLSVRKIFLKLKRWGFQMKFCKIGCLPILFMLSIWFYLL